MESMQKMVPLKTYLSATGCSGVHPAVRASIAIDDSSLGRVGIKISLSYYFVITLLQNKCPRQLPAF